MAFVGRDPADAPLLPVVAVETLLARIARDKTECRSLRELDNHLA